VGAILTVILGVVALLRMPVDVFPQLDIPVAVVATFYPGMPPLDIEADITTRLNGSSRLAATSNTWNLVRCPA
jgi:multidrug efflux pump subunit AcrB